MKYLTNEHLWEKCDNVTCITGWYKKTFYNKTLCGEFYYIGNVLPSNHYYLISDNFAEKI